MIFYVCSKENENLLDEIAAELMLPVSKAVEEKSLNKMIVQSTSNYSHINYFVVDLSTFEESDKKILEAVKAFMSMYEARLIVITTKYTTNDLIKSLVSNHIYDIVTSQNEVERQEQIKKCFSHAGMSVEDIDKLSEINVKSIDEEQNEFDDEYENDSNTNYESSVIKKPKEKKIKKNKDTKITRKKQKIGQSMTIGISGAGRKVGTTHQALLIATFLNYVGYKVCYLESNRNKTIKNLSNFYDVNADEKTAGLMKYAGIDLYYGYIYTDVVKKGYDFIIFDFGDIKDTNVEIYLSLNFKIIVGCGKPWEIDSYKDVAEKFDDYKDLNFIINHIHESEQYKMKEFLSNWKKTTFFSEYAPFLFDKNINHNIYKNIFSNYLQEQECEYENEQEDDYDDDYEYDEEPKKKNKIFGFFNKLNK